MKYITWLSALLLAVTGFAQQPSFPRDWTGNWKGELQWFKTGKKEPQKVAMELRIHPADSTNTWTWHIIYGTSATDSRPYKLLPGDIDSTGTHWVIDENNGIVLDQFWVGNMLSGAFTVKGNTIINNYRLEKDKLVLEFFSINAKPVAVSGYGTDESPSVDSYQVNSYQKAVLQRVK